MNIKQYYLQMVSEGMMKEDEKQIKKYEQLIIELDRQEYVRKTKELMKSKATK